MKKSMTVGEFIDLLLPEYIPKTEDDVQDIYARSLNLLNIFEIPRQMSMLIGTYSLPTEMVNMKDIESFNKSFTMLLNAVDSMIDKDIKVTSDAVLLLIHSCYTLAACYLKDKELTDERIPELLKINDKLSKRGDNDERSNE